jgi:hypothetical protein
MTVRTNAFGIRIPTGSYNPRANVKQFVIRLILTDDQSSVRIPRIFIRVMNVNTARQWAPERTLGTPAMDMESRLSKSSFNIPAAPIGRRHPLGMAFEKSLRLASDITKFRISPISQ